MKKLSLLFAIGLMLFASVTQAQQGYFTSNTTGKFLDTVTNTDVKTQTSPLITGYQDIVSIQVNTASLTGTPGGVVRLYGSVDGVNFVRIPSLTNTGATAIDSLTVEANNFVKVFRLPYNHYSKYAIGYTGAGTQTTTLQTYYLTRRRVN